MNAPYKRPAPWSRDPVPGWLMLVAGQVALLAVLALGVGLLVMLRLGGSWAQLAAVPSARSGARPPPPRTIPQIAPQTVSVPWPATSDRRTALAYVGQQRVLLLDLRGFYQDLLRLPVQDSNAPASLDERDMTVRFYPVTNQVYCLELQPKARAGETWEQAQRPDSAWHAAVSHYGGADYAYFFWVRNDSFEVFRRVRQALREQHVTVAWKPLPLDAPLEACSGFDGGDLRPQ